MNEPYAEIMTGFPLFQGFTVQGALRFLERGELKECAAGEVLFKEGDPPSSALLVLAGKIEVFVERDGEDLVLTEAGPGAILGELGVLCGITRSASVRAGEKATVVAWSAAIFRSLLLRYPLMSERIFKESLRNLVEKERALIDSLMLARHAGKPVDKGSGS